MEETDNKDVAGIKQNEAGKRDERSGQGDIEQRSEDRSVGKIIQAEDKRT